MMTSTMKVGQLVKRARDGTEWVVVATDADAVELYDPNTGLVDWVCQTEPDLEVVTDREAERVTITETMPAIQELLTFPYVTLGGDSKRFDVRESLCGRHGLQTGDRVLDHSGSLSTFIGIRKGKPIPPPSPVAPLTAAVAMVSERRSGGGRAVLEG